MKKQIREVISILNKQRPALRTSIRFTFFLRLSTRAAGDELWEINLWRSICRKSRARKTSVQITIPRSHFWALVEHSSPRLWRDAFNNGHIRFEGDKKKSRTLHRRFTSITR